MTESVCVALLTNNAFFDKMLYTLSGILRYGYTGDICIVIGDDLKDSQNLNHPLLQNKNIIIKYFPNIIFSEAFLKAFNNPNRHERVRLGDKIFQYHKFYMFDEFFKRWNYIFYIDSGMHIYSSIEPIINCKKKKTFLAHSDAYPTYEWRLRGQFIDINEQYKLLEKDYNLDIDYPQTGIMLYDTDLLEQNTFIELINLAEKYNCINTNDQAIIALYFTSIKKYWEQIQIGDNNQWYYDSITRQEKCNKPHIMIKHP